MCVHGLPTLRMKMNSKINSKDETLSSADDHIEDDVTPDASVQKASVGDVGSSGHPFKHSNDTSDLRLMVEGKPLYVSRVVLSLVSPVLKR